MVLSGRLKSVQDYISQLFYKHGLFCASHPAAIICMVILIAIVTCYPLLNLPLPGNAPLQHHTPLEGYRIPQRLPSKQTVVVDESGQPKWYFGPPLAYVQQLVVRSVVSPWHQERLIQTDAFRAPLAKVFNILETVNNIQIKDGEKDLSVYDVCLHVGETKKEVPYSGMLPEYNCLQVSPANFWSSDRLRFDADSELIKTMFKKHGANFDTPPSIKDFLFGIPQWDTGIKKYFLRNRQRVITYAITLMFKEYNPKLLSELRQKLLTLTSDGISIETLNVTETSQTDRMTHIFYKDINVIVEYTPLLVSYIVLFLYIYFSVRKIEMVKSKWGLAFSAVVTVVASLLMSVAICLRFGLTPSLNGSEIFPYLVVIIGLENVLVVTKSVVSTPVHLDVKFRVAKGISKEGWYIFKNLMTELAVLAVGFLTFVPPIQEFCLFAVVGLLSDFFLQMFFFTTVLSIDIRRMELSDLHKQSVQQSLHEDIKMETMACPVMTRLGGQSSQNKSRSSERLSRDYGYGDSWSHSPPPSPPLSPTGGGGDVFFPDTQGKQKLPKRVRVLNFWARTRMAQRGMMLCFVVWILLIVYKSGLVAELSQINITTGNVLSQTLSPTFDRILGRDQNYENNDNGYQRLSTNDEQVIDTTNHKDTAQPDIHKWLTPPATEEWRKLTHLHFPMLLSYYNISVSGRYISILPTIYLANIIKPDEAISMRHPDETLRFKTAHDYVESVEQIASAPNKSLNLEQIIDRIVMYPRTTSELIVTILLGIASFILFIYFMVILYKCICPRNYGRWKSGRRKRNRNSGKPVLAESEPLVHYLVGHLQSVECVTVDGPLVISSCLGGQIRVWDSLSGECVNKIVRTGVLPEVDRNPIIPGRNVEDSDADLYAEIHGQPLLGASPPLKTPNPSPQPQYISTPQSPPYSPTDSVYSQLQSPQLGVTTLGGFEPPSPRAGARQRHPSHSRTKSADYKLSDLIPDLTGTIDTDFSGGRATTPTAVNQNVSRGGARETANQSDSSGGFDFSSKFGPLFEEQRKMLEEQKLYMELQQQMRERRMSDRKSTSFDSLNNMDTSDSEQSSPSAIWCLTSKDNLVVTGCGNGVIEFWDGLTGQLKDWYKNSDVGVTAICFVGKVVIAARLNGVIDFLEMSTFINIHKAAAKSTSWVQHRGHVRTPSNGVQVGDLKCWDDQIRFSLITSIRAHQRAINLLVTAGGRVVSGSQDHTLKVYRLEDSLCLFTLHGHTKSISALFMDQNAPLGMASGSEDGELRLWDLMAGTCVHKMKNHMSSVTSVTCTPNHVISTGLDHRLCIYNRSKGELLHWIQLEYGDCNVVAMLTNNILVTGGVGCIHLWDVRRGETVKSVPLRGYDHSTLVTKLCVIENSKVVCDYDNQCRVVYFPSVLEKSE